VSKKFSARNLYNCDRVCTCATCEFDRTIVATAFAGENGFFLLRVTRLAGMIESVVLGAIAMKKTWEKTCLLLSILVISSYPAVAKHHYPHRERAATSHSRISCETVRAYVAQVGLAQAKAMAQAAGMTESEERQAVQCLEKKI
jgi:hypothetical protein